METKVVYSETSDGVLRQIIWCPYGYMVMTRRGCTQRTYCPLPTYDAAEKFLGSI